MVVLKDFGAKKKLGLLTIYKVSIWLHTTFIWSMPYSSLPSSILIH
jgi:hypothetical protein